MDRNSTREALSPRERQIAEAYADGSSFRQIADHLFIAPTTVRTHLRTIYRKLGVTSKIELLRAIERSDNAAPTPPVAKAEPAGEAPPPGNRSAKRQVTVLSATIVGLSDLAMRLDPEEITGLVASLRDIVAGAAARGGGQLLPYRGAEIGACFGLPASDETDAERAVLCALDIRDRVVALAAPDGAAMAVRIGLFTGPVIARGPAPASDDVTGAAPYLAAALGRTATGGGIVVCARTRATLGGLFGFSDLGPVHIDSGQESVRSFTVTEAMPAETRFAALHGYQLTRFVGRESEIDLLESLFERAVGGEGQLALITGEPGIGKSRTVRTLMDRLAMAPGATLVFQCSPHERSSPLHAVAQSLRDAAGVDRATTRAARLDALLVLFGEAIDDPVGDRQVLADFASIRHEPSEGVEPLPPERVRAATLALLDRFLRTRAAAAPQLVVFEDMHWADPTTTEWFERVVDLAEGLRVLIIATARPEFSFAIAGRTHATSLSLARLGRGEIKQIVADQSGDRALPASLIERIAERSDGIPLFAEELTRSILELGASEDDIPPTLQASLMGRLDRLGPAREVAQAAAVIGRDFDLALLAEIVPHGPRALDRAIDALVASKLVLRRGTAEAGALRFKHALVRDAAYDGLLRKQREALHRRLADALIARGSAGADIARELIALHLVHGAEEARSIPFWQEAARLAVRKAAEREASAFCREGLKATDKIDDARSRDQARFELMILRYMSEYRGGEIEELLALAERAEEMALRLKDPLRQSRALDAKAYLLASNGRVTEAIEAGRKCVSLSRDLRDDNAFVGANMMLGRALFAAGDYREAVRQAEIVRNYLGNDVERGDLDTPMNQTVSARVWLCFMQSELGAFEAAERSVGEARRLLPWVSAREHVGLWFALASARLESLRGNHQGVMDALEPQLELCRREYPVYTPRLALSLGHTLVATGQVERGLALLAEADAISRQMRFFFSWALLLAQYARALLLAGDAAGSEAVASRAMSTAADAGENGNAGWARLAAGEAFMALGRKDEGRAMIDAATQIAIPRGMAPLLDLCSALLGNDPSVRSP